MKPAAAGKGDAVKLWLILVSILLLPVMAQQSFELPVPPKPAKQVLDQARMFAVEPERKAAMEAKLEEFSQRTGYEVQVAFFDNLIGVGLIEQTLILKDEWLRDGPGMMLVVVTDNGEWRIEWASTPEVITEGGGVVHVIGEHDVAPQEQIGVVQSLRGLPRMTTGSIEGAERMIDVLLAELELSFVVEERSSGQRMRVWALGIGLLAGLSLLAMLAVTLVRRGDLKRRDQLVFPDVPVGQRLGAAAGGGKVSSRNFSSNPSVPVSGGDEASEG